MQILDFPITFCNELDKINRKFLWGSTETHRKIYLVGWHAMKNLRKSGGLGIRSARDTKKALLAKINWSLLNEQDKTSFKVITYKYGTPLLKDGP